MYSGLICLIDLLQLKNFVYILETKQWTDCTYDSLLEFFEIGKMVTLPFFQKKIDGWLHQKPLSLDADKSGKCGSLWELTLIWIVFVVTWTGVLIPCVRAELTGG